MSRTHVVALLAFVWIVGDRIVGGFSGREGPLQAQEPAVAITCEGPSEVVLKRAVIATLELENRSSEPVVVDLGFSGKGNLSVSVVTPTRGLVRAPRLQEPEFHSGGTVRLKPQERFSQSILLNEWVQFDAVGDYEVMIDIDGRMSTSAGKPVEGVKERACSVKVGPRDEQALRAACDELSREALTAPGFPARDAAARALGYVSDPVAVSHLEDVLRRTDSRSVASIAADGLIRIGGAEARAALERVSREAAEDRAAVARGALKMWKTPR
jgi:hypothetical protein